MPNIKPATASKPKARASSKVAKGGMVFRSATTGQFLVPVGDKTLKTLAPRQANIKAIMEVLGDTIERSQKSGRASEFRITIDPKGGARIFTSKDPAPREVTVENGADADLERALDAARERGRLRAAEVLSGDEMLSGDEFAELIGVSRVTVNTKRQRHEVLALDGAKRGYRFPAWQVDENGKPFAALPKLFQLLGNSPWTVYRFLLQRHPELDGARASDLLRRGRSAEVLETAESVARGGLG